MHWIQDADGDDKVEQTPHLLIQRQISSRLCTSRFPTWFEPLTNHLHTSCMHCPISIVYSMMMWLHLNDTGRGGGFYIMLRMLKFWGPQESLCVSLWILSIAHSRGKHHQWDWSITIYSVAEILINIGGLKLDTIGWGRWHHIENVKILNLKCVSTYLDSPPMQIP